MRKKSKGWSAEAAGESARKNVHRKLRQEESVPGKSESWLEKAKALKNILNNKLYKADGYANFDLYVEEKKTLWGLGRSRAWSMLAHLEVAQNIMEHYPRLPTPIHDVHLEGLTRYTARRQADVWSVVMSQVLPGEVSQALMQRILHPAKCVDGNSLGNVRNDMYLSSRSQIWHSSDSFLKHVFRVIPQSELHLDAAGDTASQKKIKAKRVITEKEDGTDPKTKWWLDAKVKMNVYLNTPGGMSDKFRTKDGKGRSVMGLFLQRAIHEYEEEKSIENIIIHLRAAVGQVWFRDVYRFPHCWLDRHVRFDNPVLKINEQASPHGSVVVFMGTQLEKFCQVFGEIGRIPGYNSWSYKGQVLECNYFGP